MIYNGIDEDCDDKDLIPDDDGDVYLLDVDYNDQDSTIHPGAVKRPNDPGCNRAGIYLIDDWRWSGINPTQIPRRAPIIIPEQPDKGTRIFKAYHLTNLTHIQSTPFK